MIEALIYTILALVALTLITSLIVFFKIFYSPRRKFAEEYPIPDGEEYEPYREQMVDWIKQTRKMDYRAVSITSHDGLTLRGKYFEYEAGAPIEILFHGYRGSSERDLSGGVYRCHRIGHNALIVDHRASGESDGHIITFGAKESQDCLRWIDFVINEIDKNARIIITGISMGASTVMIASSKNLPKNVIGVLADCGYTSTKEIIKKVMRDMKLPSSLLYPFAWLGAVIFGGFIPDSPSPVESMKKCALPVIFFHGDDDGFVPHKMSEENYNACAAEKKRLVITEGAGHGLCFPANKDEYFVALREFFGPIEKAQSE